MDTSFHVEGLGGIDLILSATKQFLFSVHRSRACAMFHLCSWPVVYKWNCLYIDPPCNPIYAGDSVEYLNDEFGLRSASTCLLDRTVADLLLLAMYL